MTDRTDPVPPSEDAEETRFIQVQELDVAALPEEQRFPAFAAAMANSRLTRLSSGPFAARARFWRTDPLVWSEQWLDPLAFERDRRMVHSTPSDHFQLVFMIEGKCVLKGRGRDVVCGTGDAILTDLLRPELVHGTRQHSVAVLVPRWYLHQVMAPVDIHGRLPRNAAGRLLFGHVCRVLVELPGLTEASAPVLAGAFRGLLAAALAGLPPLEDALPKSSSVRIRAKAYLEDQPMGALDVARLCDVLGVSRASLYRAFNRDGGVIAYDRRRRLVGLHRAIADPAEERGLADLGLAFGFTDKSHLSHAFREAFGYTASELRAHVTGEGYQRARPGSVQDRYQAAVRALT